MGDPEIHPAARRHRVSDDDIRYVYANPIRINTEQGDWELTVHTGFAVNGQLIEVGFAPVENSDQVVIIHAMRVTPERARRLYNL